MKRPNSNSSRLRGLYVITQSPNHLPIARAALHGGARIIQLRDPHTPLAQLSSTARALCDLTRQFDALLVINDHLELAREVGADGFHIEWANFSLEDARRELGAEVLLSTGVSSLERALLAQNAGADYIGVGPVYPTQSKDDAGAPIGLLGLRAIEDALSIPIAAIGGLNESNIAGVRTPMACVLSALSGVSSARRCEAKTRELVALLESALESSGEREA